MAQARLRGRHHRPDHRQLALRAVSQPRALCRRDVLAGLRRRSAPRGASPRDEGSGRRAQTAPARAGQEARGALQAGRSGLRGKAPLRRGLAVAPGGRAHPPRRRQGPRQNQAQAGRPIGRQGRGRPPTGAHSARALQPDDGAAGHGRQGHRHARIHHRPAPRPGLERPDPGAGDARHVQADVGQDSQDVRGRPGGGTPMRAESARAPCPRRRPLLLFAHGAAAGAARPFGAVGGRVRRVEAPAPAASPSTTGRRSRAVAPLHRRRRRAAGHDGARVCDLLRPRPRVLAGGERRGRDPRGEDRGLRLEAVGRGA